MNYLVRFMYGHHGSIVDPTPRVYAPDAEFAARTTQEMQSQAAAFLASHGMLLPVTDAEVVAPAQ